MSEELTTFMAAATGWHGHLAHHVGDSGLRQWAFIHLRMDLEVIKRSGTERERRAAEAIEPVIDSPHHLLATLLLCNSMAMEA